MSVCPNILLTDSIGIPLARVTVVANVCRAISKRVDIARYPNKNKIQTFTNKLLNNCILPANKVWILFYFFNVDTPQKKARLVMSAFHFFGISHLPSSSKVASALSCCSVVISKYTIVA